MDRGMGMRELVAAGIAILVLVVLLIIMGESGSMLGGIEFPWFGS